MLTQDQQIIEQLKKAENVLITFNRTWNGDAIASALAMYLFLGKLGKKATIAAEHFEQKGIYSFLPAYDQITNRLDNIRKFLITLDLANAKPDKVKYQVEGDMLKFIITPKEGFFTSDDLRTSSTGFQYDLIVTFDTPDLEALGSIYDQDMEFFYQVPIINFDHHAQNEGYGQINVVELTAVSTSEILFNLISGYSRDAIDENIATCLLTGIISKTRSFRSQNLTPQALIITSQLITMGARREEIVDRLYRSRPLNVLKLWGRVLARLTGSEDGKLVWSVLNRTDFHKTDTNEDDLAEVIDELIVNIPDAKVIVLIHEVAQPLKDGTAATKALIYTMKSVNALLLAKSWNPTGTKNLASVIIPKDLAETEKELIGALNENLNRLSV